jgi:hypothetical protein
VAIPKKTSTKLLASAALLAVSSVASVGMAFLSVGLLPVSQTPSLGVMMKPEVANGKENVHSRVQA